MRRPVSRLQRTKLGLNGLFLMAMLFVACSHIALAQVSSSVSGRIEDPSGAAVPGASVTVTSLETGGARTVTVDERGGYLVLSLPVGRYEVKAAKQGFKEAIQTGIDLVVGQQAVVNLKLEVGAVQEQVTITSDAPLVNTTTSSVAGLVGEREVKDLPLNGRSFDLLITLNPGTANYTGQKSQGGGNYLFGGNVFSVVGRRPMENLTMLNGVQYSGASIALSSPGGASGQLLGVDAVREYNVVADSYGVEYGQRAGAQITMVTQSGTNRLHGSVFEFLRNSALDARNFFDTASVPPFERNQFGGALGGPIRKDKTFLFGNYEGFRERLGISDVVFVPDLNARQGKLPCGSNGVTCATGTAVGTPTLPPGFDSRILPFMELWPLPNGPVLGGGIAIAYAYPTRTLHEDFGTTRFDQTLSDKDSLSSVYTISDGNDLIPVPGGDPFFGANVSVRNQVVSLQETHIFSPQVFNTVTAGFTRAHYRTQGTTLKELSPSLSFVAGAVPGVLNTGPNFTSNPWTQTGINSRYLDYRRNLFTYTDAVQMIRGKHQISAGVWFQRIQQNDQFLNNTAGQVAFGTLTSFLQGIARTFQIAPIVSPSGWRSLEGAWYLQDSIQLRPNLTVRLGVRHEFSNGWSEVNGLAQNSVWVNRLITLPTSPAKSLLTENNSKWLFSPRIGVAWDPFGKGKTSIRSAFGVYHDLVDWLATPAVDISPPLNGTEVISNTSIFSLIPFNTSAPKPPPCGVGVTVTCTIYAPAGFEPNFKVPTVYSWTFSVEQQLTGSTALRVAYVGSHANHLPAAVDPNTIAPQICSNAAGCTSGGVNAAKGSVPQGAQYVPAVGVRPNAFLGSGTYFFYNAVGNYNSLQTEVKQRLKRGLMFRANYTWAKNLDLSSGSSYQLSGDSARQYMVPTDPHRDYGRSGFDVRHQATGSLSYELPFGQGRTWMNGVHGVADKLVSGWQLNGIITLLSGPPFGTVTGSNISGNGDNTNNDRPNWNPAFTGEIMTRTPDQWFNANAFSLPTSGTFGNVGRNVLTGPGLTMVDLSLFKTTKISERVGLQFRAEVFNSMNHANFLFLLQNIFNGSVINPAAGRMTATTTTSRQIQFGLKLVF